MRQSIKRLVDVLTSNAGANCGIGRGGFQAGNKCAKGSGGGSLAEPVYKAGGKLVSKDDAVAYERKLLKENITALEKRLGKGSKLDDDRNQRDIAFYKKQLDAPDISRFEVSAEDAKKLQSAPTVDIREVPKVGRPKIGDKQLEAIAKKIGKAAYDRPEESESFFWHKVEQVNHVYLSDIQRAGGVTGDFTYGFKPSTGEVVELAAKSWKDANSSWADSDGFIYTYSADDRGALAIVKVDSRLKKAKSESDAYKPKPRKLMNRKKTGRAVNALVDILRMKAGVRGK